LVGGAAAANGPRLGGETGMKWLNYKLYANVSDEPKQLFQYTPTGRRNIELIERQTARFYDRHQDRIKSIYIFRFWQDIVEAPPQYDHVAIPDRHYAELIRLRFRVQDADYEWAFDSFKIEVIDVLEAGDSVPRDPAAGCLKGWRFYKGYEARDDVGARFGDLAHGVDLTEQIVEILTGWTKLRFRLLDHPEFKPNHDLTNLYYNTIGLTYPEEIQELEARMASVKSFMGRAVGL
jgi:hypothetical protein